MNRYLTLLLSSVFLSLTFSPVVVESVVPTRGESELAQRRGRATRSVAPRRATPRRDRRDLDRRDDRRDRRGVDRDRGRDGRDLGPGRGLGRDRGRR